MTSETPFNPPKTECTYASTPPAEAIALIKSLPDRIIERMPYCATVLFGIVPDDLKLDVLERISKTPASLVSFSNLRHFTKAERLEILNAYKAALENVIAFVEFASKDK